MQQRFASILFLEKAQKYQIAETQNSGYSSNNQSEYNQKQCSCQKKTIIRNGFLKQCFPISKLRRFNSVKGIIFGNR